MVYEIPILQIPSRKPKPVQVRRANKARSGGHNWLVTERVNPWVSRTFVYSTFDLAVTNADLLARTGRIDVDGLLSAHGTSEKRSILMRFMSEAIDARDAEAVTLI